MKKFLTQKNIFFLMAGLFVFYCFCFFPQTNYPNTVVFQGDEVDYQPMALNFARGHGLLRPGILESAEDYKFVIEDPKIGYIETFFNGHNRDEWKFTRNPGWPVVLGMIYMVFGNNPIWAYRMELVFLIFSAVSLVWIGWKFWGPRGLFAGVPSGLIFLYLYLDITRRPLTEPLMILMLSLVTVWFIRFREKPSLPNSFVLGLLLAFSLLVKGSFLFLPVLVPLYAFLLLRTRLKKPVLLKTLGIMALGITIPLATWSTYASIKDGGFLFLSHQGGHLLRSGTNELTILQHGGWHKNWDKYDNVFYKQDNIKDLSIPHQVILFYKNFFEFIPRIIQNKIHVGFVNFKFIKGFLLFFVLYGVFQTYRQAKQFSLQRTLVLLGFSCFVMLSFLEAYTVFLLASAAAVFLLAQGRLPKFLFPGPFFIFLVNTILITLLFFGEERFTYVIDCFFILLCVHAFFLVAESMFKEAKIQFKNLRPMFKQGLKFAAGEEST